LLKTDKAIIVEGKYDKIRLESVIDGLIIQTDGFKIFKDKQQLTLIRTLAEKCGIIIITDSDSAGFKIRSFISKGIKKENITNVYVPDIYGKEKRKEKYSAQGKLGVEGMSETVLEEAFLKAGIGCEKVSEQNKKKLTKAILYSDGFCGKENSEARRRKLQRLLELPEAMSANCFIDAFNALYTYEDYEKAKTKIV